MKPVFKLLCLAILSTLWTVRALELDPSTPTLPQPPSSPTDVAVGSPYEWMLPKYPKLAKRNKLQGPVTLRLSVDEKGQVTNASVLTGDQEMADASVRAVRKWKYSPYVRDGKAIQFTTVVTINFKLTESGHPDITATYPGYQGLTTARVFKVGNGVSPPRAVYFPDPDYAEQARKAKYQGTCILAIIVGPDGRPYNIHVAKSIGNGLSKSSSGCTK